MAYQPANDLLALVSITHNHYHHPTYVTLPSNRRRQSLDLVMLQNFQVACITVQ